MADGNGNGNGRRERERVELFGEPRVHPPARNSAKQINKAVARLKNQAEVTPQEYLLLAIAMDLNNVAETLGTAHFDAKTSMGLLRGRAASDDSTSAAEIDF